MSAIKTATINIISERTVRRIAIGVVSGHLLALMMVLTWTAVAEWFTTERVETITVQFYDPNLDNVVENPSPDPDPNNPVPPTGTQDGGAETPLPEEPPVTEPPPTPDLTPVTEVAQPQVTPRARPRNVVNTKLPKTQPLQDAPAVSQPKVKPRTRKPQQSKNNNKTTQTQSSSSSSSSASSRNRSRGSNSEAGHNAPGGERGNSGYDVQVAMMIKRMWVTPDLHRLGGREPRVLIEIEIAPNGRIIRKAISKRSGVLAMDESIDALLNTLHQVTPPFDGKKHTLTFWIKAEND